MSDEINMPFAVPMTEVDNHPLLLQLFKLIDGKKKECNYLKDEVESNRELAFQWAVSTATTYNPSHATFIGNVMNTAGRAFINIPLIEEEIRELNRKIPTIRKLAVNLLLRQKKAERINHLVMKATDTLLRNIRERRGREQALRDAELAEAELVRVSIEAIENAQRKAALDEQLAIAAERIQKELMENLVEGDREGAMDESF